MRKTLEVLVESLNMEFSNAGYFDIYFDSSNRQWVLSKTDEDANHELVLISKDLPHWLLGKDMHLEDYGIQSSIVNFLANSSPTYWFPEKKYNIIIGMDSFGIKNIYKKSHKGKYLIDVLADKEDFNIEPYLFTESEIEDLKSNLPENMQKIVDLGKAEVEDD